MVKYLDAVLLRIFLGQDDRLGDEPLYQAIVRKARKCSWGALQLFEV